MKASKMSIIVVVVVLAVFGLLYFRSRRDNFLIVTPDTVSEQISSGTWNYAAMPFNNCLDANKVYCSGSLTRQPGGCMAMRYYPRCGTNCNFGCPPGCPNCKDGTCQN